MIELTNIELLYLQKLLYKESKHAISSKHRELIKTISDKLTVKKE